VTFLIEGNKHGC